MDAKRVSVGVAVGLVLVLTFATGPFGPLEISTADESPRLGTGSADVTVVTTPDTATITPADHGAVGHYLEVPDAVVDVERLRGNPILEYRLKLNGLGYARTSVHTLGDSGDGRQTIVLERDLLEKEFDRDTYNGTMELILRGDRETVLLEKNITVTVNR